MTPLSRREALERGRFSPAQKLWVYASSLGTLATGLALFYIRYGMRAVDAFSAYHTPSEPLWALVHGLFAPLLIFALGFIFLSHIRRHFQNRLHLWSGGAVFVFLVLMSASGYFLNFFGDERLIRVVKWTHVVTGFLFGLSFFLHLILGRRAKRREGL